MERLRTRGAAAIAAAAIVLSSAAVAAQDLGDTGGLTAGIPEPNADFQAQDAIHEGGQHFFYFTDADPADVVGEYEAALEEAGWTILDSGGGGDPFGLFASGAGLTAENPDGRYLKLNAGGPGGSTFIDGCVWPQEPDDDDCQQQRQIDTGDGAPAEAAEVGSSGDLTAGIPEPADSEYQSDDAIDEGGRHFYYISNKGHFDVWEQYQAALQGAGWDITDSGSGGSEFGGGGNATATDGTRYLKFNVGGGGVVAHFDACVWPQQPEDDHCPQSDND